MPFLKLNHRDSRNFFIIVLFILALAILYLGTNQVQVSDKDAVTAATITQNEGQPMIYQDYDRRKMSKPYPDFYTDQNGQVWLLHAPKISAAQFAHDHPAIAK